MTIEIKARKDDPTKVDFFVDGKKVENITATRVDNYGGKLVATAVITGAGPEVKKAAGASKKKEADDGEV